MFRLGAEVIPLDRSLIQKIGCELFSPLSYPMKIRPLLSAAIVGCVLITASGCAVFSKGRTQSVTIRSNPEGATALINGEEVGKTPLRVTLKRSASYNIELRKPGFENAPTVMLPVENEYAKRYLRWGLDYDLGAMTDLTPGDLMVDLRPALPPGTEGDRYLAMTYAVLQADALFSANEISASDHKFLVAAIVKSYAE